MHRVGGVVGRMEVRQRHSPQVGLIFLEPPERPDRQLASLVPVGSSWPFAYDNVFAILQPSDRLVVGNRVIAPFDGAIGARYSLGFLRCRHSGPRDWFDGYASPDLRPPPHLYDSATRPSSKPRKG
jgi:hypothetical protein